MDDGGHRENGRHKADQYKQAQGQWLMQHQPSMKQIMAIMAERDAAIQERNLALSEKKAAIAERDMVVLQRDAAIVERNNAMMERDNAIATLQYRENLREVSPPCPPGCQISRGVKHMHHPQQQHQHQQQQHQHQQQHMHHPHPHHPSHMGESPYNNRDMHHITEPLPLSSPVASDPSKSKRGKRAKEPKEGSPNKKPASRQRKGKREGEDLNKMMFGKSHEWKGGNDMSSGGDVSKSDWKGQDLGLNQVAFDDSTMPAPACSCTGVLRQCYKWGNGGWQSSCCTTTMSMYPLPSVPNKRHARVGGRKMSGSVFSKLLSRLASEGHDLSIPVDLKDHWAKHGTNRYITIK